MVIYVDILFFINFLMDTLLLATTALIAGRPVSKWRVPLAAALGGLEACILFFEPTPLLGIPLRICLPIGMLLIAFPFERLATFGKTLLLFLTVGILFGGGIYAFYALTDAGSHMLFSGGVYYMDLPLWLLLALSFGFYGLARLFFFLLERRKEQGLLHTLEIDGSSVLALLDTGNSLYDPITLTPVALCQWDSLTLPEPLLQAVLHRDTSALPRLSQRYPELKLRLLPYTDASGGHTLIYAFRPKRFLIDGAERRALVGIVAHTLAPDGRFRALLHRDWSNL